MSSQNFVIIGSGNGLVSNIRQAITWTIDHLLSFERWGTNLS